MIDIVFPKDNEKDFIRIAERLDLEELFFTYTKPTDITQFQKQTKIKISSAVLCNPADVKQYKAKHITIVRAPEKPEQLRGVVEQQRPHVLFGLESQARPDFLHHRASGLNHVLAALAKENGVCIGLSFSDVLESGQWQRQLVIGRMMQNIKLARKFRFQLCLASFARSPWQLRPERELASFFSVLGMAPGEIKGCLGWKK